MRRPKLNRPILLITAALCGATAVSQIKPPDKSASAAADSAFFESKVRPILIAQCFSCHSEGAGIAKGGLKLDSRANLMKGGGRGAAVVPGDLDHSLIIKAIRHGDEAPKMPPSGKLRPVELAILEAWVKSGAAWPAETGKPKTVPDPKSRAKFWAFVAPKLTPLPKVKNTAWAQNPMDQLVLAGLERKGLKPAPVADRRTLIRRATFDLTGLPPTPAEIKDFLADSKPGSFSRVVDRLLASPAYGERWGRHWLDVARYADSNGVDENLVYTQAWRYRDYVVRAFNQNRPIDRFIQEQIAGDLLPKLVTEDADLDHIIATGYLSLGPKMLAEDDPVKQELDVIDEQIDTLGKTFLGLTLGCARCHDHKFDPLPQTDYYALAGIFKSTKTMLNYKNMAEWQEVPLVSKEIQEKVAGIDKEIKEKRTARQAIVKKQGDAILDSERARLAEYRQAATEVLSLKVGPLPNPTIATPDGPAPADARVIEAENFVRGNVLKDTGGFGKGIGVLVNAGKYPNRTEYEIDLPDGGSYQLDLRYASGDSRPIRVYVNGSLVKSTAAGGITGGFNPAEQKWFAEGVFAFQQGKNTIKFERDSYFPHIDKFLLIARPGAVATRTAEQIATEHKLQPEFLNQTVEKLKLAKPGENLEIELELPDKPERLFVASAQSELKSLDDAISALNKSKPNMPKAMAVSDGKPMDLKVHVRGDYQNLGENCARGFPKVINVAKLPSIAPEKSGRLELAQWMTDPSHPLTSRVFVNRVWRWHFGKGLVGTTDNFGLLGDRPANQPLLDWLAVTFIKDGWDLKKLHKRIMLSNTYQMSSKYDAKAFQVDPGNTLQWRMDRKRLEVEAIRDSILAVSGQLDKTIGGSLLKFQDRQYVTSTANSDPVNYKTNRRSLYLPVIRSALYDVYTAFDFGDPTVMNGDRPSTTVAPQALFMMNSALVLESTKAMATRLLSMKDLSDSARYQLAFEECYGRTPSAADIDRTLAVATKLDAAYTKLEPDAEKRKLRVWQSLCKTLVAASDFIFVD